MSLPEWLTRFEHAALAESLHHLAWIDGRMRPSERDILIRFLREMGVEAGRAELVGWLMRPPEAEEVAPEGLPPAERMSFLSLAIRLASEDGHYDQEERGRVAGWAEGWGIDPLHLDRMEREAKEARG